MTYEDIEGILKSNHFYPRLEQTIGVKKTTTTGLIVDCPVIVLMEDRVDRIKEVLLEAGVTGFRVAGVKNEGYILISKK